MYSKIAVLATAFCVVLTGCDRKIPVPGKRENFDDISGFVRVERKLPNVRLTNKENAQTIAWKVKYSKMCSELLFCSDNVYFVDASGELRCYDVNNGMQRWKKYVMPAKFVVQYIQQNKLMLMSENGAVAVFDVKTRTITDKYEIKHPVACLPAVTRKNVLVITTDGYTYCFGEKLSDGPVWVQTRSQNECMTDMLSSPVVAGNIAYCAYHDGALVKLDIATGNTIWESFINANNTHESDFTVQTIMQIAMHNGTLIVSSQNDNLSCIDKETGVTVWHKKVGTQTDYVLDNGWLFLISADNQTVVCIRASDGACKWSTFISNATLCGIATFNNKVIVVTKNGELLSLNANSGAIEQTRKMALPFVGVARDSKEALYTLTGLSLVCIR